MIIIKGWGELHQILSHYQAIPILIEYIKKQPDHSEILKEWDNARDRDSVPDKIEIEITI